MSDTNTDGMRTTFLIDAYGDTLLEAGEIRTADKVIGAVNVPLAFVRNSTSSDEWVTNQSRSTFTCWSVVDCYTGSSLSTVVLVAGIKTVILSVMSPLTDGNRGAIVVCIASLRNRSAARLSIVRISNEVIVTSALCDVVVRTAVCILTT